MRGILNVPVAALALALSPLAPAGDFDGSKPLICAPVEATACASGDGCASGIPDDFGAPAFMRIDFQQKQIVGPKRASAIRFMEATEHQLLLQGTELGHAWSMAIDAASGRMAVTMADRHGAFVVFGACTPR
jgi:hypothetical protein